MPITMRRFTPADWLGFSGSIHFEDGTDPYMGGTLVDGRVAVVIVDRVGLYVEAMTKGGDTHAIWFYDGLARDEALAIAESFFLGMSGETLVAAGFKRERG